MAEAFSPDSRRQQARESVRSKREEVEDYIRKQLTAGGVLFNKKLEKALAEEFAAINSDAGDAIREIILQHHLRTMDSVKTVNRLAETHQKVRITCYYMIMNYANILLSSGYHHSHKGILNHLGQRLLQVWRIYANKLIDQRIVTHQQIDHEEAVLMESIAKAGRSQPFSFFGAVKSVFRKKGT